VPWLTHTGGEQLPVKAGEFYNMQCPLAGDCKIGLNWAMTH
jgi:hypothetical protein